MDVHSGGDRSISLEIAAEGPLVATERLIKLIDRNSSAICISAIQTRDP